MHVKNLLHDLSIRLSAAKTRFTQSKFRMLYVLHCVVLVTFAREKKERETLFKQTLKITFHIITSLWIVFGLSTLISFTEICVKFRFTGSGFWAPNGQNEFTSLVSCQLILTFWFKQCIWNHHHYCCKALSEIQRVITENILVPVSYTHLTLPTKRIV